MDLFTDKSKLNKEDKKTKALKTKGGNSKLSHKPANLPRPTYSGRGK